MKSRVTLVLSTLMCVLMLSGCWDRKELNDLGIEMGFGLDILEDGKYKASGQLLVLSGQGPPSQGETRFFVETGIGKNILDAISRIQAKMSRKVFLGQRKVIVVGEELARHGLLPVLDEYSRNPDVRLRTTLAVVKGDTAENVLKRSYPLERLPSTGILKEQRQLGFNGELALFRFLESVNSEGSSPTLPAISLSRSNGGSGFQSAGMAVFNHQLQLTGFLNTDEEQMVNWIRNQARFVTLSVNIPHEGMVTVTANHLKNKIVPQFINNKMHLTVILKGDGTIHENDTNLNVGRDAEIHFIQHVFDKHEQDFALHTISKMQKDFDADIFGFNESVHRKYPRQWRQMKENWDATFSKATTTVQVNLSIRGSGLTTKSLVRSE